MLTAKYRERADKYDLSKINEIELPSRIFDRNRMEIGRIFTENRDPCKVEDVPRLFIDTLIAAEDARFYSHSGYDPKGIMRVLRDMALHGGHTKSGGASTLTQQLARNAYHLQAEADKRGESTKERKLVEIFLARRIEKEYTKNEILEFYLNRVNFGGGYHGIRSASLGFFGKEPRDLEIQECASLVGSIRNPAFFCPTSWRVDRKTGRRIKGSQGAENIAVRNRVLKRMAEEGKITWEEMKYYQSLPLGLNPHPIQRGTSHFHDKIASLYQDLIRKYGKISEAEIARGGFKIFTTVDREVQRRMQRKLQDQLAAIEARKDYKHPKMSDYHRTKKSKPNYLQGAGMMINHHTGEVIAYIGGRNFGDSQYDFIKSGRKPMGTAFLPFIYASALENGMNSASKLIDEAMDNRRVMIDGMEGVLAEWGAEVMNPIYEGEIPMRRALANSKIAATVRLGRKVGLKKVWQTAERFGFQKPSGRLLNKTLLGSEDASLSELVRSYGVFPSLGKKIDKLVWITRIETRDGKVIYKWDGNAKNHKVTDPASAYLVSTMLEDALKTGSGARIYKKSQMGDFIGGGKTGTTSDFSNHWFVGYNSDFTCGVWAGFYDGKRRAIYPDAFSADTVMPIWVDVMKFAQKRLPYDDIPMPADVVKLRICKDSGMLATKACEEYHHDVVTGRKTYISTAYVEYFRKKFRPRGSCPVHGASLGIIENYDDAQSGMSALDRLNMVPIKPKDPTLLGEDPYHSETPVYADRVRNIYVVGRGLSSLDFDHLDKQNQEAKIRLDGFKKLEITD